MTDSKQGWKVLTFRDSEIPPADADARIAHIRNRAMEKFHLAADELNMAENPACPGTMGMRNIENGGVETHHVCVMQITAAAAERLAQSQYPEVLAISDVVERPKRVWGVLPPKGPKIRW